MKKALAWRVCRSFWPEAVHCGSLRSGPEPSKKVNLLAAERALVSARSICWTDHANRTRQLVLED
eukprot:4633160-Alexandrium_andersonii.AAC.1